MKEQSTTKGFAILSFAGIMAKVISLLYVPLLINILGEEGYGVYTSVYQIFALAYVITNTGMQTAISKQVSELIALNNHKDAVKTFKIARSILFALSMFICMIILQFSVPIARGIENEKGLLALITLAPAIVVTSVLAAYRGYFQGRSIMTPTAVSQVIEQLFNAIFTVLFAAILVSRGVGYGAAGGTIGTVLSGLFAAVYLIWMYRKSRIIKTPKSVDLLEPKRLSNGEIVRKLFKYGIPITLSATLQNLGVTIDMIVVRRRLIVSGLSTEQVDINFALLSKYTTLVGVPLALIAALCAAIIPSISRAVVVNDRKTIKEKIGFAFKMSYLVSIPSAVGLAILSKPIYELILKTKGYDMMQLGAVALIFMSIVQIQTIILQCMNKLYLVLISLGTGIIIKIITNYILVAIPGIGVKGAIIGTTLSSLIPMIINNIIMKRTLKMNIGLLKYAVKPTLASILMAAAVILCRVICVSALTLISSNKLFSNALPTLISILVGMIVYGYGMILTGGVTRKDVLSVSPKIERIMPGFMKRKLR
ncbi:putative polysaccharide biosynthesis protein [Clostridium frigidicarnis]|uniref:Stage V sporulation protein B n=1 Tax=Clostridium frigidicarnis TaxID=84698 RepID=A0A1I0WXD6_9CLOT|nr:polysaccharide biosynthesis protein [Clostridium frigidicarnis]SFA92573.1 stage V sporulation protein B [Clostridium frigidicarnis]